MANVPTDAKIRKSIPLCTGLLDYFPDALLAVAQLSRIGNDQHNPGEPLHWAKEKSIDEPDALMRHLIDRGKRDIDGVRHSTKVAWRALALLQREIEAEETISIPSNFTIIRNEEGYNQILVDEKISCFGGPTCACGGKKDGGAPK